MNPFFFGSSSQSLYGVYHSPNKLAMRDEGVLLCPTFGQEYMRSHRANRQLASSLAQQGFHVLRFDYRGTGDSSGYIEDVCVSDWLEDIETAINELRETTCVNTIHVIGLRLGGLLASAAARDSKLKIKQLILWDPLISGNAYDLELQDEISKGDSKCNVVDSDDTLHFNGFPLYKKMRLDLSEINLCDFEPQCKKIYHIVSSENENSNLLKSAWSSRDAYEYEHVEAPGDWNHVDQYGGIMLPQPILQAITHWLAK